MKNFFSNINYRAVLPLSVFLAFLYIVLISSHNISYRNAENESLYDDYMELFHKHYGVFALNIPDTVYFAGEIVPIYNFDVYESFDRELHVNTYWHSQFYLYLKRANRFLPIIEPILKEHNIPDDFKYLCIAESGLSNVVSPAGASGFWQFMKKTGESYNLIINDEIDERYHLQKSTVAACKYLKDAYKVYKNWALVAAAYNMGQTALDRQIRQQKVSSYYDLLLNDETSRYVFRIAAIKMIFENPKKFGFNYESRHLYHQIPTEKIIVDSTIANFADFALEQGINYKILRILNPWIRSYKLTNPTKREYEILIPKEGFRDLNKLRGHETEILPDTIY